MPRHRWPSAREIQACAELLASVAYFAVAMAVLGAYFADYHTPSGHPCVIHGLRVPHRALTGMAASARSDPTIQRIHLATTRLWRVGKLPD
jgi:hypothetical protein